MRILHGDATAALAARRQGLLPKDCILVLSSKGVETHWVLATRQAPITSLGTTDPNVIHIDACRVPGPNGRWPSNIVLTHAEGCAAECIDDCPVRRLDGQSGTLTSGTAPVDQTRKASYGKGGYSNGYLNPAVFITYGDSGGASRFFPCLTPAETLKWLCRLVQT